MNSAALHPKPLILAHRGSSTHAPENTLAAFQLALEQGADGIELDVQLSADGEVVVCHDGSVNRTTDGQGKVAELTLSQLKRLDAGAWFAEKFSGERIPTLLEVLESQTSGLIDIELKPGAAGSPLPDRVASLLKRFNLTERTIVTSFLPHYLSRLRQILPEQPVGLLELNGLAGKITHAFACGWINLAYVLPHHTEVTPRYVQAQHRSGRKVISWTVDDPAILRTHQALELAGIITNNPQNARKILEAA